MNLPHPKLSGWQPPPRFTLVPSKVEGISIYAPIPETPSLDKPVNFKCPKCGATTRYNIEAGGVACEHCGYTAPIETQVVGRQAEQFEFTLETLEQSTQGWGVSRRELSCASCGANLTLPEGALSITCPFCASNKVNIHPAPSDVLRPRHLIPFKLKADEVKEKARQWLGKGWFHPPELGAASVIDRFNGIYLPIWTFDARIVSQWKAEVGYEHQERYYNASTKSWQTRTVIRWRWENGRVSLDINDLLITGSSKASRIILERLFPFNLNELCAYDPGFLAGWQAQAYDISLPAAWEEGKARMRDSAKHACRESIKSGHVRNFSMTADFKGELWRYILLPVYLAAYQFEGKVYQVMVNGQTGSVAGQKPVAWWKIWLAVAGLLSPGLLLGLIGLPLLLAGGLGIFPLFLGLVLLGIGAYLSFLLYQKAVESEAA
jgi:LSD1 subclass zinc finger protein